MPGQIENLVIEQGKTFSRTVRWESLPFIYKTITAITKASPVQITAIGHAIPDGWRAAVVSAGGMRQLNAKNWPLRKEDFHPVTVLDANTVNFNGINSADFTTYTSGGALVYYTPVDLAGFTARMQVRASAAATATLLELTTENSRIVLDNTAKTITLTVDATTTAALAAITGVYDLELVSSGGVVTEVLKGTMTIGAEVTR